LILVEQEFLLCALALAHARDAAYGCRRARMVPRTFTERAEALVEDLNEITDQLKERIARLSNRRHDAVRRAFAAPTRRKAVPR
jgi:hypothetical protein